MPAAPKEVVYVNGGQIYKAPVGSDLRNNYAPDPTADPIFPFTKRDGKRYIFTREFRAMYGETSVPTVALDDYDLCPAVNLWTCIGAPAAGEKLNFDLFFAAESTQQLRDVAAYYKLAYPLGEDVGIILDTAPDSICFANAAGMPIVPGGIKFIAGKPAILKLYTYPKPAGSWDVYMYGVAYHEHGKCFEKGAVYEKHTGGEDMPGAQMRGKLSFRKAEVIYSERADGVCTSYAYTQNGDPCMFWQGNEIDADGQVLRVKRYESSRLVQRAVARLDKGPDFAALDLCPAVKFWVGRAWYDDADEQELLFAVTGGSAMLDVVAAHYGLAVPYGNPQKRVLNSSPELYRARHYDLLGLGVGHYVNVVVGGVTFIDGKPTRLVLYTFLRQWEFDQTIELPAFD